MPSPQDLACGPAGWSYSHWNAVVYPRPKPRGFHPLTLLAGCFDLVEINTSFYQYLRPEVTRCWLTRVADNPSFVFTAKLFRGFTHERRLDPASATAFKEGLWPLLRAGRFGCLLMQFPWAFRYTEENREYLIRLRRAFHEFPLAAEFRHSSWMYDEALGTLIDYRIGFVNIDQPPRMRAMPPTAFATSEVGYVRLHGRGAAHWVEEFGGDAAPPAAHDYLYTPGELEEWKVRIERIRAAAARTFVVTNNDAGGKSVVNALQLAALLGVSRGEAPSELMRRYPAELAGFECGQAVQRHLFQRAACAAAAPDKAVA